VEKIHNRGKMNAPQKRGKNRPGLRKSGGRYPGNPIDSINRAKLGIRRKAREKMGGKSNQNGIQEKGSPLGNGEHLITENEPGKKSGEKGPKSRDQARNKFNQAITPRQWETKPRQKTEMGAAATKKSRRGKPHATEATTNAARSKDQCQTKRQN